MTTNRYLLELAVHVKLASEAIVAAAQNLAALRPDPAAKTAATWRRTMDDLATMNVQIGFMEEIVRAAALGGDPGARVDMPRLGATRDLVARRGGA
jgi:hypothetical protein